MDQYQNPLGDSPLGRIAQEIYGVWRDFSEKESSGIPQLKREARELGSSVEIKFTIEMSKDLGAETLRREGIDLSLCSSESNTENMTVAEEAKLMGFSTREVEEIEDQQSVDRFELIASEIRETAPKLALRIRNWMCQYIGKKFPELEIGFEKVTPATLATVYADKVWLIRVEEIIASALKLPRPLPALTSILSNMKRLEGLEDIPQN